MPIFPQGRVDYTIADVLVAANSRIFIEFIEDPGNQMGAGTLQWIELNPGVGFTMHLNTVCQEDAEFLYTIVTPGPSASYWDRSGTTLFPINLGDSVEIRNLANTPLIRLDATTGFASYITHPTFTLDTQIVDKRYVDDAIITTPNYWNRVAATLFQNALGDNLELRDFVGATRFSANATSGDVHVFGKLTVDGAIDPTYLQLTPGTAPGAPANGQIYYNLLDNRFYFRENGIWNSLAGGGGFWSRTGTTIYPATAGDSIRIDTNAYTYLNSGSTVYLRSTGSDLLFRDTYLSAAMPISESGTTGLSSFFSGQATSIVRAINYLGENMGYLVPTAPLSMHGLSLTIHDTTLYTGYLSDDSFPNEQHFVTLHAGDSFAAILDDATFNLTSPNATRFNYADRGILSAYINGTLVESVNLLTAFDETYRAGNQGATYAGGAGIPYTSPLGYITITSVGWYNNWPPYQRGTARINIVPANLHRGENEAHLVHSGMGGGITDQTTLSYVIFYDDSGARPFSNVPLIWEGTLSSTKYLSGVRYYSTGDTFNMSASLVNAFNNTYHATPLVLTKATVAIPNENVAWNDPRVSGHLTPPRTTDTFFFTDSNVAISLANIYTINGRITIAGRDPIGIGASATSLSENRLINTYGNYSTTTLEEFVDENRRLSYFNTQGNNASGVNDWVVAPGSPTGNWNSQTALANGEAQCYNDGLYYPRLNYTVGYFPTNTVNYSAFAGSQYYVRCVPTNGNPSNSGTIQLVGWTLATFLNITEGGAPIAVVELKIPGRTGWYDLGRSFGNGNGCRISAVGDIFGYSTGTNSTAPTINMIILRITLLNNTVPLLTRMVWTYNYT